MGTSDVTAAVTELRLVALTPDGDRLVLEDATEAQFHLDNDDRLATALRSTARAEADRTGRQEGHVASQLSPREIQARVRAGQSVDDVAAVAGIAPDRVERYAGPVLAERAHVVELAQRAPARRASGGSAPALAELVALRLAEQRVAPDSVSWDAWRGDDDRWTVRLDYLGSGRTRSASWVYDPRSRVLAAADDEARWLVDDSGAERVVDDVERPSAVRRLSAVPVVSGEAADPSYTRDEVYDRVLDEADEAGRALPVEPTRRAASGRGRHPAIPSWDDIMFGPRRRD